jgi:hypothetical protein
VGSHGGALGPHRAVSPASGTNRYPSSTRLGLVVLLMSGLAGCGGQATAGSPGSHASGGAAVAKSVPAHSPHRRKPTADRRQHAIRLVFSRASNQVVQAQPSPGFCHARGHGLYSRPDPHCTPGALNPAVRQANIHQTICVTGWTATVRPPESVTESEKLASLQAYGDAGPAGEYEYDHLVPLELGGATNDPHNLWPEPGPSPNPKDAVELDLRDRVCSGEMTLVQAQRQIASDWPRLRLGGSGDRGASARPPGSGGYREGSAARCRAHAVYDPAYGDFDVYVNSNQPDRTVTVTGAGHTRTWHADTRGAADVYFPVRRGSRGRPVTVRVGSARCVTSL